MIVPADLEALLDDAAAAMGVAPGHVLRACVELAMSLDDEHALVLAVERVVNAQPRSVNEAARSVNGGPDAAQ